MFRQRKSSGIKYLRQTTKSCCPEAKGVCLPARDARNGMAPIDEVEIEIVGEIPLIRNATGTFVLSTDREPVWED